MAINKIRANVPLVITTFAGLMVMSMAVSPHLHAQNLSPEGYWKTISDKTGKATSIVKVWIDNGELFGKVDQLIKEPGENPDPICKECPGEKKDQPIKGMTFLWGFTQDEDEWNGGYILDPDNGKTYTCVIKVVENGRKLHVRGYILFRFLGRTQVWHRAD